MLCSLGSFARITAYLSLIIHSLLGLCCLTFRESFEINPSVWTTPGDSPGRSRSAISDHYIAMTSESVPYTPPLSNTRGSSPMLNSISSTGPTLSDQPPSPTIPIEPTTLRVNGQSPPLLLAPPRNLISAGSSTPFATPAASTEVAISPIDDKANRFSH
eukprot:GHVH01006113.1.p1 GENE.GHVH01006113.1~~GHVH01006113.1.p1  ORF type:complete len:159 (-),score=10.83 GHVH01006113.1:157-633(-)